jgi:hypothetical protein
MPGGSSDRDTNDSRAILLRHNGRPVQVAGWQLIWLGLCIQRLLCHVYPMETKSMAGEAFRQFIHNYGRPERLTFDGSSEQCGTKTEFMKNVRKYSINSHITDPERPYHNFAEGVIREVRKKLYCIMVKKKVPQRLWDYGLRWVCQIQSRTSNSARGLDGKCPLQKVTGESVDISE